MSVRKELLELHEMVAGLADVGNIAYIRPVAQGKGTGYVLFAADGTELATFPSRDAAYFTARQHDLEPVSVH